MLRAEAEESVREAQLVEMHQVEVQKASSVAK